MGYQNMTTVFDGLLVSIGVPYYLHQMLYPTPEVNPHQKTLQSTQTIAILSRESFSTAANSASSPPGTLPLPLAAAAGSNCHQFHALRTFVMTLHLLLLFILQWLEPKLWYIGTRN